MIRVCDVCGQPAQESVTIRVGAKGYAKDLCGRHLTELLNGTRAPKRGRRPAGSLVKASASASQSDGSAAKPKPARRRRTAKRVATA
jgi:hypothetical protein